MDTDTTAPQSNHVRPTPRVGGAAIVLAFGICSVLALPDLRPDLIYALMPGVLVFLSGLQEDLYRNSLPVFRLVAAFVSAAIAIAASGALVPGLGFSSVDRAFDLIWISAAVTLLWSAGTCHAVNLIDGLNGLAACFAIFAGLGIAVIAGNTGDADIRVIALILVGAVLGFAVINWPTGRIFMGDAGAYGVGHILAWLTILLMYRNPEVSGFAMLLVLFWPIGETTYSIIRRIRGGRPVNQPDKLHFHHIVLRWFRKTLPAQRSHWARSGSATLLMVPLLAIPVIAGVVLSTAPLPSLAALCLSAVAFITLYQSGMSLLDDEETGAEASRHCEPEPAPPDN